MSTEIFAISRENVLRLFDTDESTGRIRTTGESLKENFSMLPISMTSC
jgi:hypothetical protein